MSILTYNIPKTCTYSPPRTNELSGFQHPKPVADAPLQIGEFWIGYDWRPPGKSERHHDISQLMPDVDRLRNLVEQLSRNDNGPGCCWYWRVDRIYVRLKSRDSTVSAFLHFCFTFHSSSCYRHSRRADRPFDCISSPRNCSVTIMERNAFRSSGCIRSRRQRCRR